ncbi:uncharacterized protein LOC118410438 [Branchiostoma floridae]|uniref:Uncharacterized protein LOC118410438 n=1 Tax=Branchiostoma floridae TaxID=7739 RepID=A0A9J7KQ01_BRAFL|nr:uncharacterized protein LOC118410438 [Branchiostoma floridae]
MDSETPWCFGGKCTIKVSAVQVILGLACASAGVAGIFWDAWYKEIGYGIWSGILFIMTGSTGIHAAKDWKKLWIMCFLVTSAASALVATFVVLPLAFMAIQIDKPDPNRLAVDGILFASALLQGLLSGATFFMAFCGCCTAKGRKRVRYPRQTPAVGVMNAGDSLATVTVTNSPYLHHSPAHGTFA